ncbi:MAG TPA: hypothetical protein VGB59_12250 [Allosphingosinicella sp.]|jgi:hypothetical protein
MRDLFKKVMTGSMVAGAALLVAACGGGESTEANNTANLTTDDALMGNDVTAVDAMNGTDANLGTTDMNATTTTTTTNTTGGTTDTTTTGNTTTDAGTGTGNTTGM